MSDSLQYGKLDKERVLLLNKTRSEYQLDILRYISFTWNEKSYIQMEL